MPTDTKYNLAPAPTNSYGLQPATSTDNPYGLSAAYSSDNPYGLADAPSAPTRFFNGGQGEVRAYQPTPWDKIRSLFGKPAEPGLNASPLTQAIGSAIPQAAVPALAAAKKYSVDPLNRAAQAGGDAFREAGRDVVTGATLVQHGGDYLNATLPSPYGPKPPVESVERRTEREHPVALGVAGGVGSVIGSTITDPRNWPFLASSAARPMLQKLIAGGFSAQMSSQTYQGVRDLYDHWDELKPEERAELGAKTGVGALFLAKGLSESVGKKGATETPTHITHAVDPSTPLGQVLAENAPSIRVADSAAAARDLLEKDTLIRPPQPGGDRRLDVARRKQVSEMTPKELKQELLTSQVTGLPNRRAFDEAGTSPAVAMSDADGLKALNDKYGYAAGDALLRAKAESLQKAGVDAYHDKGDEFVYRGQSPAELSTKLEAARDLLRNRIIDVRNPDGTITSFKGADFSYGTGQDITEAESGLKEHKAQREAAGERARGQLRGITELRPGESGGNQGATERLGESQPTEAKVSGPRDTAAFINPSARVVSANYLPVVAHDAVLAEATHNIISNSDELQRAGVDVTKVTKPSDIDAVLQRASDVIKSGLDERAEATITFQAQTQLAADLGMSVEQLLSRKTGEAFNTEQALAARALLVQSSRHVLALARLATQSGDSASLEAATTAIAQHQAIQEKVAGITAEAGRALGGFNIGKAALPEAKVANVLSKLSPEARAEAVRLLSKYDATDPQTVRKLGQFVAGVKPATTMDKLFEYYRNSLLSSPHTIIVKTASEASMAALEAMKKVVAGGISKVTAQDRYFAESWYYAKGMVQALAEHARPVLTGEFQLEGSPGFERAGQQAIKGVTGQVVRAPSEAMSRMTNLIYAGNYFGEINALAARQAIAEGLNGDAFHARQEYLSHHPTDAMQEAGHKLAATNTFQNELTGVAKKAGELVASKPNVAWLPESWRSVAPGRWLFPFFKTPVNLLKASLTHATPYELLNGLIKHDPDALARGVLGSSISAAIAYMALNGTITGGGPTDYKKEETKRATGWQPYSIKLGDHYFSYKRFEPLGLTMGLIADAVHGSQNGDGEVVAQSKTDSAVKHVMRNLDDMPFMGTLANLLQAVHDPVGGRAQSFVNREAGSIVPAGVANVAETLDPTVRRPQSALQAIQSRIPGLTAHAPAIVDITGESVKRPASNLGGAWPFPVTENKHDPVVDELARLGVSTPQPPTQIKLRGKPSLLTADEKQAIATQEGQEFYRRVARSIQSGQWQRESDDRKRLALARLHRDIEDARPARLARIRRAAARPTSQ